MREGPRFIGRSTARIRRGAVTTGNWARAGEPGLRVLFPGLPAFAYVDDKATPRNINYKTQNLLQNERITSPQIIIQLRRQQIVQLQIIPQRRRHVS